MNIGVKIENMHDLQDEVVLKKLKEIKVKHLEIQIKDCNKESMFFTQDFSQYILEIMNRYGFTISFHGTLGINYLEKIDRLRETAFDILKDMLILCDKVNATWLTLHIGECGSGRRNIETRLNRFIEEINNLYLNRKFKTIIAVENMPTNDKKILVGDNISDISNVIENTKNVRMLFDIGHYEVSSKINEKLFINDIVGVHIHDNDGKSDLHMMIGEGVIDFNSILSKILSVDKDIPIILEYRKLEIDKVEKSILYLDKIQDNIRF